MISVYSKQALKVLNSIDIQTQRRIKQRIERIPEGDIKPLQGYADGRNRLRVGKYRIIFRVLNEELFILEMGSRGGIYK